MLKPGSTYEVMLKINIKQPVTETEIDNAIKDTLPEHNCEVEEIGVYSHLYSYDPDE